MIRDPRDLRIIVGAALQRGLSVGVPVEVIVHGEGALPPIGVCSVDI